MVPARTFAGAALLAFALAACATQADDSPPPDEGADATADGALPRRDAALPSPDALVLGGDAADDAAPEAAPPPFDSGAFGNPCSGHADGYQWFPSDPTSRCCHGQPMHEADFTTNDDCGVCGIKCNPANGEACAPLGGHYFCRGCLASADCWSKCCSTSFSPYSCSASDCQGNCDSALCPPGTHCVNGLPSSSDYCAY